WASRRRGPRACSRTPTSESGRMMAPLRGELKALAKRFLRRREPPDYREMLFEDLRRYVGDTRMARILEIGPKDGRDTRRLLELESATIRRRWLRHANCVEIIYPPSDEAERKYHLSPNITHLPSARAVESWLAMVGFERISRSDCHRKSSAALARHRVAYLAT